MRQFNYIYIDGKPIIVSHNVTIREATKIKNGIYEIPHYCYHERMSVAGNCRICIVEVENTPKPVMSCRIPISIGMKVYRSSPIVIKARESVTEIRLVNHPLDCAICDQGGECDLQDNTLVYGSDRTRFINITKRAVEDKEIGVVIHTVINRCIHCTRCVRYSAGVLGIQSVGLTGRGTYSEVGTYVSLNRHSNILGNRVDVCPVGALTSKLSIYEKRAWEVKGIDVYDVIDSLNVPIRLEWRGTTLISVLPRRNDIYDGEWITDKSRYGYDSSFDVYSYNTVLPLYDHINILLISDVDITILDRFTEFYDMDIIYSTVSSNITNIRIYGCEISTNNTKFSHSIGRNIVIDIPLLSTRIKGICENINLGILLSLSHGKAIRYIESLAIGYGVYIRIDINILLIQLRVTIYDSISYLHIHTQSLATISYGILPPIEVNSKFNTDRGLLGEFNELGYVSSDKTNILSIGSVSYLPIDKCLINTYGRVIHGINGYVNYDYISMHTELHSFTYISSDIDVVWDTSIYPIVYDQYVEGSILSRRSKNIYNISIIIRHYNL